MFDRQDFRHWGRERMFHRGDFKYLILDLLRDKPRYGYEIIRELEERFHGFYSPSPGVVYPTLQYLEDMGYVTSAEKEGKRIYTITDEGRKFLDDESKTVDDVKGRARHGWDHWGSEFREEFREIMWAYGDIGRMIGRRARGLSGDKMHRIGDVIKKACGDIEKILREEPTSRA